MVVQVADLQGVPGHLELFVHVTQVVRVEHRPREEQQATGDAHAMQLQALWDKEVTAIPSLAVDRQELQAVVVDITVAVVAALVPAVEEAVIQVLLLLV